MKNIRRYIKWYLFGVDQFLHMEHILIQRFQKSWCTDQHTFSVTACSSVRWVLKPSLIRHLIDKFEAALARGWGLLNPSIYSNCKPWKTSVCSNRTGHKQRIIQFYPVSIVPRCHMDKSPSTLQRGEFKVTVQHTLMPESCWRYFQIHFSCMEIGVFCLKLHVKCIPNGLFKIRILV